MAAFIHIIEIFPAGAEGTEDCEKYRGVQPDVTLILTPAPAPNRLQNEGQRKSKCEIRDLRSDTRPSECPLKTCLRWEAFVLRWRMLNIVNSNVNQRSIFLLNNGWTDPARMS